MSDAPIFITGLPRSGTSLVASCFALCGAWVGETDGPSPYNQKGNCENRKLREGLLKPYLSLQLADPQGQHPLPPVNQAALLPGPVWRDKVLNVIKRQGYRGGIWAYKDAKLALCWKQWQAAFPEARWIVVRRDAEAITDSALAAEPIARRWQFDRNKVRMWVEAYHKHLTVGQEADTYYIWPQQLLDGDYLTLHRAIEACGLEWRQNIIKRHISLELWHG